MDPAGSGSETLQKYTLVKIFFSNLGISIEPKKPSSSSDEFLNVEFE